MKIGIIDYGAGNLMSLANALKRLGQDFEIFSDPQKMLNYKKLILPGVGAADVAMQNLNESGFVEFLPYTKLPLLGICVGLQLFADFSEEGDVSCLGIIPGKVKLFGKELKRPQIGWNKVSFTRYSLINDDIPDDQLFYFVNSYYLQTKREFVVGTSDYGVSFPSIVEKGNFFATQFHPEKSGEIGLNLLNNFCKKC